MIHIAKYIKISLSLLEAIGYRLLTRFVPKKKNRWVFGCWKGRSYSDNARALFEYVQKNCPEIESLWVAKNDEVFKEVTSMGYSVVDYRTLKGKLIVASANVSIQTESNSDTGKYKISGAKIIQLWHGIGDAKTTYNRMNRLKKAVVEIYSDTHRKSYWMTSSEHQKENIYEYFNTPREQIFVTGTPRTDSILSSRQHDYFEKVKEKKANSKFIAYMPTHRKYGDNDYNILAQADLVGVNDFLVNNNYVLFIKPHPLEANKYKNVGNQYENIEVLIGDEFNNTQEYLHYFDALVSDYSSISYDYLCLNRPIILFTYDFDDFIKTDMGLRDDYISLLPGPNCSTWNDVCTSIKEAFEHDSYSDKRTMLIPRYYKYIDNNNCKRVYDKILEICGNV